MESIFTLSSLYAILSFIALMSVFNLIEEHIKSKFRVCCVMFLIAMVVSAALQAKDFFAEYKEAKKEQKALAK